MSDLHLKALNFQANDLPTQAIALYTQLLATAESYDFYILRGLCYLSLNNFSLAIKDYESAILYSRNRHEGFFRRGICNFKQGNIKSALIDLEQAKDTLKKQSELEFECKIQIEEQIQKWIEKCEAESGNIDLQKALEILNQNQQVKDIPQKQEEQKHIPPTTNQAIIKSSSGKIAYSWYQTNEKVVIEIQHALGDQSQLKKQFKPRKIELSFPLNSTNDYILSVELFEEIENEKTEVKIQLKSIEVIMYKVKKNLQWIKLEKDEISENAEEKQVLVETKPPSYPSSSKYYKDWNKLEKEIDKEFANEKTEDPMAGIFGEIYRNADENTKRAMIKSYQTSGGTVLSTNWDEVQGKDYEGKDRPDAPKGQEWQKWEK